MSVGYVLNLTYSIQWDNHLVISHHLMKGDELYNSRKFINVQQVSKKI